VHGTKEITRTGNGYRAATTELISITVDRLLDALSSEVGVTLERDTEESNLGVSNKENILCTNRNKLDKTSARHFKFNYNQENNLEKKP
jgi:hypothetical protein